MQLHAEHSDGTLVHLGPPNLGISYGGHQGDHNLIWSRISDTNRTKLRLRLPSPSFLLNLRPRNTIQNPTKPKSGAAHNTSNDTATQVTTTTCPHSRCALTTSVMLRSPAIQNALV